MAERLHFDRFTLDTGTRELLEDGAIVHLPPKAFDLLELLVQKRPEAVPRAEIEKGIWRSTHVSDTSLAGLVGELRKALGDQRRPARLVRTVPSGTPSAGPRPRCAHPRRAPSRRSPPIV